ncbi:MAG: hypothetical protein ACKVX9_10155 [Blastocatellia bacterium]
MTKTAKRSFLILLAMAAMAAWAVTGRRLEAEASTSSEAGSKTGKRSQAAPTYNKEVVRILQKSCQTCHHPGDIAPFSMMTYRETRPWAASIREQVITKKMPPWKPLAGCGDFRDARGLAQEEINTLVAWVDGGAPEGNASDLPPMLEFPDGWSLGAPDLVIAPETEYTPPTQGDMYRCFTVPAGNLRGDRWIGALTVKPGNARIVHHVIAYGDPTGESVALDAKDPEPGYRCFGGPGISTTQMLGGWAPGSRGYFAPDGTGIKLNNNSRVVVQVHYHPTGEKETDRTLVGLYFSKKPVERELQVLPLVNTGFTIPAGAKNYDVTASFTVPALLSAKIWAITPHMHLLGKKIKVELTRANVVTPECLVDIPQWDFNWQGTYLYNKPVELTPNSRLRLTCNYDNSTDNPFNPNNPPKAVRWGEETTDEMALAFIGFTLDALALPLSAPSLRDVIVDGTGALSVGGAGFLAGADIEINGHSLRDTAADAGTQAAKLSSSEMWKVYAAPGQQADVAVLNPDGVRTPVAKFVRPGTARPVAAVSAASFAADALAPEAIGAAFGTGLATATAIANATPLPTELAGTRVRVNGVLAPLFFVAAGQVNFLVPAGVQSGSAVLEILAGDNVLSRGAINLVSAAASLFTSNATGTGAPAAVGTKDGVTFFSVGNPDGSANPLDAGDYLVLFGTGFRKAPLPSVRITIGGRDVPALYAGAQGSLAGLDQINTQIPAGLSGLVDLVVSINGKPANTVRIRVR